MPEILIHPENILLTVTKEIEETIIKAKCECRSEIGLVIARDGEKKMTRVKLENILIMQ